MQSPCIDACKTISNGFFQKGCQQQLLGNQLDYRSIFCFPKQRHSSYPCISCNFDDKSSPRVVKFKDNCRRGKVGAKGKENVWSIDNEMARVEKEKERPRRRKKRGGKRVKNVIRKGDRVLVSGSMLMEVETVLQAQVNFEFMCYVLQSVNAIFFF